MPSRPGDELTSITTGPLFARSISTPHMFKPMVLAASTAVFRSAGDKRTTLAEPPLCKFDLNSPGAAWRFIAATTLPPTTRQRMSAPPASFMYSCTSILALSPIKASIMASAAFSVSAKTTPMPWVPSNNLITTGAPPTFLIKSDTLSGRLAKPVLGMPIPLRDSNCRDLSLSRLRLIATDSLIL